MDDIAGKAYRIETEIMDSLFGYDSDDNKVSSPTLENKADSSCTPPIILSTTYQSISLQPMPFGPGDEMNAMTIAAPLTLVPKGMSLVPFNGENQALANLPGEIAGPNHPFKSKYGVKLMHTEDAAIDEYTFDEQYKNYQRSGYAMDASSNVVLGDYNAFIKESLPTKREMIANKRSNKRPKVSRLDDAMKLIEEAGDDDGPWVTQHVETESVETPEIKSQAADSVIAKESAVAPVAENIQEKETKMDSSTDQASKMFIIEPDEEEEKWEKINERKSSFTLPPRPHRGSVAGPATSTFHGQGEKDFLGRPWTFAPSGVRPVDPDHNCYIPKKCIKKYLGHNKGVNVVEFLPGTGHLILSASLDGKCKIWDVYGDRNVKRTYSGHSEAIRSANFSNEGTEFLSSAFDRYIRLWDVETGQVKGTFSNRKMSYQVKYHPKDSNIFLAPANDNKIYQWDIRSGTICQTYNHHLQAVNAVLFFDDGKKFVSSSDDKKLLVWEYDIPVPITYIADPDMFSMPYLAEHPSGQFLVGQSMDNSIPVYACTENGIKPVKKRVFRGHNNSGYSCQIGFSPNGKVIMSGDGFGKAYFWDWKSMTLTRKFQAHDSGPCMGLQWHPIHPSWIVTCGWDGLVKLWE